MKKALTILEFFEYKTLEYEFWPLALKLFLRSTSKTFKGFSYAHFEFLNRKCQKTDEYFFIGRVSLKPVLKAFLS